MKRNSNRKKTAVSPTSVERPIEEKPNPYQPTETDTQLVPITISEVKENGEIVRDILTYHIVLRERDTIARAMGIMFKEGEREGHRTRKEYIVRRDAAIIERDAAGRSDGEILDDLNRVFPDITIAIVKAVLRRKRPKRRKR